MGTLLKIVTAFFKIGILTVGGGLAMIPVIQQEMERLGWMNSQEFLDILGVAQMTPGAISVNVATFSGFRVMADNYPSQLWVACLGALVGTLSVCSPSFLCINVAGQVWSKYREHACMISVFSILRPLVTGLIMTAALFLLLQSVCGDVAVQDCLHSIDWFSLSVAAAAMLLTISTRLNTVYVLVFGVVAGIAYGMI
ncbi:MAG: chromate transporter [Kiritimatiellia bacterium]